MRHSGMQATRPAGEQAGRQAGGLVGWIGREKRLWRVGGMGGSRRRDGWKELERLGDGEGRGDWGKLK